MAKRTKPGLPTSRTFETFSELEREVMVRLLECEPPETIMLGLGMDQRRYDSIVLAPTFMAEFNYLARHVDRRLEKRLENLSQEAVDVVRGIMRTAASPAYRLRAALEILDRSGHVKVEKRLQINADAETIIKHLNQLGTKPVELNVTEAEVLDPIDTAVNEVLDGQETKTRE
jgi:hypothetical protein